MGYGSVQCLYLKIQSFILMVIVLYYEISPQKHGKRRNLVLGGMTSMWKKWRHCLFKACSSRHTQHIFTLFHSIEGLSVIFLSCWGVCFDFVVGHSEIMGAAILFSHCKNMAGENCNGGPRPFAQRWPIIFRLLWKNAGLFALAKVIFW